MTIEEKIQWLKDCKSQIAYYLIGDIRSRWSEFLEAYEDIGDVYQEAEEADDKELIDAYHTMLEELEKELEQLVFNNI